MSKGYIMSEILEYQSVDYRKINGTILLRAELDEYFQEDQVDVILHRVNNIRLKALEYYVQTGVLDYDMYIWYFPLYVLPLNPGPFKIGILLPMQTKWLELQVKGQTLLLAG